MKKRFLICVMALALVLAACGNKKQDTAAKPAEKPALSGQLSIGTGPMGGAYYPFGQTIANLVSQYSGGLQMAPEVTGGAVENCRLVISGDVDISLTNENFAYAVVNGLEPFTNMKTDINVIARLYPSVLHIMVPERSSINTIDQLKGKRLAVGLAGGGTLTPLEATFKAYGMSMSDIVPSYIAYNDGFTQMADGNVDAALSLSGFPAAAVMEYTATNQVKFVNIGDDKFNDILKVNPYFSKIIVPADTYKMRNDGIAIGIANVLIVRADAKEEVVYAITACIFDHLDEFVAANANAKDVHLKAASEASVTIHPGAARYYKEHL